MSGPTVAIDARLVAGESTGDSTYWTGLLFGLSCISSEFRFLLFSNADQPPGIPWCDRFEWIRLDASSSRYWSAVKFPKEAKKRGAGVIHTQYTLSPLASPIGVTTIHDVSFFIGPQWFRPKDRFLLRRTVPASAKRAAAVITVSETSKGEIERFIPSAKGKTFVTHLACPPWIRRVEDAERVVKDRFGLEPGYLLTVGTRWPRKNMDLAVKACAIANTGRPLVITGKSGWGQAEKGENVRQVGYVDAESLSALYSAAGLYLAPSFHEGFGIPLIEAFTCGCPAMCSEGGALPETAGDAAIIMDSWEPKHWASAIERALGDSSKLQSLREKGFRRAAEFSWEETAQKTLEVYRRVIG